MTSGIFTHFPISEVFVREDRQRRNFSEEALAELAESIAQRGLINPIVITRTGELVAGERRWRACTSLGWTTIPAQFADDLSRTELEIIELEENVKRVDLDWKERALATHRIHTLLSQTSPGWTLTQTAQHLAISQPSISHYFNIAEEILKGNERVLAAPMMSKARTILKREKDREINSILPEPTAPGRYHVPLLNFDFLNWSLAPHSTGYNFIHCDFPYGINADKHDQGASATHAAYSDTKEDYFTLLTALIERLDNFAGQSCHIMFWYSMEYHDETYRMLSERFWIDKKPLVWLKSDNTGMASDALRRPRYIYETAFYGSRGDRKLAECVANAVAQPTTKLFHMSEKPLPVLAHFFRLFVDKYTTMLDPTAGSGTAVVQARLMGAGAIGLERDASIVEQANAHWKGTLHK